MMDTCTSSGAKTSQGAKGKHWSFVIRQKVDAAKVVMIGH